MSTALIIESLRLAQPPHKLWTRTECEKLTLYGLLDPARYELIEGELLDTMGKNQPQVLMLAALLEWFVIHFPSRIIPESPIDVALEDASINDPESDLVLLRTTRAHFTDRRPTGPDIALLIEVADSSLLFDTTVKANLYARAGVEDYWVVDVNARRTLVFRDPRGGEYRTVSTYHAADSVSPLAAPDALLSLNEILPSEN